MQKKRKLANGVMDLAKKEGNLFDEELEDKLNAEKQALPDVYHKMNLLKQISDFERQFDVLQHNRALNCGRVDASDLELFKVSMMVLFDFIRNMILEQVPRGKLRERLPRGWEAYTMLCDLEVNPRKYSFEDCVYMKRFLLDRLHKMNITNLLINPGDPFDDFFNQ